MRFSITTLLVAVAGLALAGAASAEQRYADATGDAGVAPDLGQVVVSNDAGNVQLQIAIPPRLPEPDETYLLLIDSDSNGATGEDGADVQIFTMGLSIADAGCRDGEDELESDDPFTLAIGRPTVTPPTARSGGRVTVKARIRPVETDQALTAGTVRCSARIGSSTKRGPGRLTSGTAICTLSAPKVSKPTSIKGSIAVSSKSKTASTSFAFRVR
jgi:hypothetical protein